MVFIILKKMCEHLDEVLDRFSTLAHMHHGVTQQHGKNPKVKMLCKAFHARPNCILSRDGLSQLHGRNDQHDACRSRWRAC